MRWRRQRATCFDCVQCKSFFKWVLSVDSKNFFFSPIVQRHSYIHSFLFFFLNELQLNAFELKSIVSMIYLMTAKKVQQFAQFVQVHAIKFTKVIKNIINNSDNFKTITIRCYAFLLSNSSVPRWWLLILSYEIRVLKSYFWLFLEGTWFFRKRISHLLNICCCRKYIIIW